MIGYLYDAKIQVLYLQITCKLQNTLKYGLKIIMTDTVRKPSPNHLVTALKIDTLSQSVTNDYKTSELFVFEGRL